MHIPFNTSLQAVDYDHISVGEHAYYSPRNHLGYAETEVRSSRFVQIDGRVNFPTSVEIVDNSTGETSLLMSQKPKEIVVVGSN